MALRATHGAHAVRSSTIISAVTAYKSIYNWIPNLKSTIKGKVFPLLEAYNWASVQIYGFDLS
jgi:hypothetical protein